MGNEPTNLDNYVSLLNLCELEIVNSKLSAKHKQRLMAQIRINKMALVSSNFAVDDNSEQELLEIYEMLREFCNRSSRESRQ